MNHILKMTLSLLSLSFFLTIFSCKTVTVDSANSAENKSALQLVNEIRTKGCKCGSKYFPPVNALVWNSTLEATALAHSKDMSQKNYFGHIDKRGNNAEGRLDIAGYKWMSYGENIFQSTDPAHTVVTAVQAWKDSPGHCENLMKDHFTEMAIGEYKGYWTQLLGSR
ncbi:Uncharacterized conserved protein YkwD, contains CAP (CSP/antigen 5/PR1) domain [Spirosomataceae bacterium TFI 002]|nr:Uncharacterized conserved protein YkwD, contains CAP (CSP/antigen 5/PR1) domain [Spirosomataceae bacterium TFI 002]